MLQKKSLQKFGDVRLCGAPVKEFLGQKIPDNCSLGYAKKIPDAITVTRIGNANLWREMRRVLQVYDYENMKLNTVFTDNKAGGENPNTPSTNDFVPKDESPEKLFFLQSTPVMPEGFAHDLIEISSIENEYLWAAYCAERERMLSEDLPKLAKYNKKMPNQMCVERNLPAFPDNSPLNAQLNECWLVHGTSSNSVIGIIDQNFKMQRARNGRFGRGLYFAEDAFKSIQYARGGNNNDKKHNTDSDFGHLFIVRALVGYSQPNMTKKDMTKAQVATNIKPEAGANSSLQTETERRDYSVATGAVCDKGGGTNIITDNAEQTSASTTDEVVQNGDDECNSKIIGPSAPIPGTNNEVNYHCLIADQKHMFHREFIFDNPDRIYPAYVLKFTKKRHVIKTPIADFSTVTDDSAQHIVTSSIFAPLDAEYEANRPWENLAHFHSTHEGNIDSSSSSGKKQEPGPGVIYQFRC